MAEQRSGQAARAVESALRAQAEGLGLWAWVGAAMMDHVARTGNDLAGFLRDETRRDLQALGALATCRSPDQAAAIRGAYLGEKLKACTGEAERLARRHAEICDVTRRRMSRGRD